MSATASPRRIAVLTDQPQEVAVHAPCSRHRTKGTRIRRIPSPQINACCPLKSLYQGTGSAPPGCHGWHRRILLVASHPPCAAPYLPIAVLAYSEQVG